MMRRSLLPIVLLAAVAACSIEIEDETRTGADFPGYVERMLTQSAAAWNRGDMEGFLSDYLASETTTYIGSQGLILGIEGIRERFAPQFAPGEARDSLRFESVRTRRLGALYGLVTARWILYRDSLVTGSGPFTLVLRRVGSGWKIIHDHTAPNPAPEEPLPAED